MTKRKRYSDEQQADCILMLEAAGYPGKKGALARVGNKTKVSVRTLRRWWLNKHNPVTATLVRRKKGTLIEKLDDLTHLILDSFDIDTIKDAHLRERMVSLGIVVDKGQLLKGEPTERVENLTTEQRRDRIAELFESARTRRTPDAS